MLIRSWRTVSLAVMTRELEKLALYLDAAPERPRELDDAALDAVGADLGDSEM